MATLAADGDALVAAALRPHFLEYPQHKHTFDHHQPPVSMGRHCDCATWADRVRIGLDAETADLETHGFVTLLERNPWLRSVRCRACGAIWYLAVDTVDDELYFRRLTRREQIDILERGEWPTDYDHFVNVWPFQEERSVQARLAWPWKGDTFERR
jgi:hypothetical protein